MSSRVPSAHVTPAEARAAWERDGFVVAPGMFSPAEVEALRTHFMEWNTERREDFDQVDQTGQDPLAQFPRIIHPHRRDERSMAFLLDSRVWGFMRQLLDEEPLAAQTMFYFKPPGARGQALHQDQKYLRAQPGTCLAAWLAVDDCTPENGCLEVVPGSHRLPLLCTVEADTSRSFTHDTVPVPDGYEVVPVRMGAGDVLFFHGNLIHGSGPNATTDRFRRSLIAHYITGDAETASRFYHPLLRQDGTEAGLDVTPDGGACGIVVDGRIEMVGDDGAGPVAPH